MLLVQLHHRDKDCPFMVNPLLVAAFWPETKGTSMLLGCGLHYIVTEEYERVRDSMTKAIQERD